MSRFLRRLVSAVAMWAIALAVVFTGNEVVFFLLISALGLAGLWERAAGGATSVLTVAVLTRLAIISRRAARARRCDPAGEGVA